MKVIGTLNFNYPLHSGIVPAQAKWPAHKSNPHMKTKILILAVLSSLLAVAALLLSFRSHITAESAVGYAFVLALLGLAALEYRINWKRLFGRS